MRRNGVPVLVLAALVGCTSALAQTTSSHPAAKHRHGVARPAAEQPATPSSRQGLDTLLKGSPEQQAAEREDRERAGIKPIDHRKDDFFSDWRGLR